MPFTVKELLARDKRHREESLTPRSKAPLHHITNDLKEPLGGIDEDQYFKLDHIQFRRRRSVEELYSDVRTSINAQQVAALRNSFILCLPESIQKHVVIAGGSVLAAALFHQHTVLNDIDIFLVGVTRQSAPKIIQKIVDVYSEQEDINLDIVYRSASSITMMINWRSGRMTCQKIQIVLRSYKSHRELLYGFDLQCGAMALTADREGLMTTELGLYALQTGRQIVDTDRRSATFERRLRKYNNRGIQLLFPYLDVSKIQKAFCMAPFDVINMPRKINGPQQESTTIDGFAQGMQVRLFAIGPSQNAYQGFLYIAKNATDKHPSADYKAIEQSTLSDVSIDTIVKAIEDGKSMAPDAFLPVPKQDVVSEVDIRTNALYVATNRWLMDNTGFVTEVYRRFLPDHLINQITFDPIYKFSMRTQAPSAQWTSSFDPVVEAPSQWYPKTYFTETPVVEDLPVAIPLPSNLSDAENLDFGKDWDVLTLQVVSISSFVAYLPIYFYFQPNVSEPDYSVVYDRLMSLRGDDVPTVKEEITMNDFVASLTSNFDRYNKDDRFMNLLQAALASKENQISQILRGFGQKNIRKLRRFVTKLKVPSNTFIYQTLCRVGADYTVKNLQEQAGYFGIPAEGKTKRQLCAELAMAADRYREEYNIACGNDADDDLVGGRTMGETPGFLRWIRTAANGIPYCYNVLDMDKVLQSNIIEDARGRSKFRDNIRDPRGVPFSQADIVDITQRADFLRKVFNAADDESFTERYETRASEHAATSARLAEVINEKIPYTPMAGILEYLPIEGLQEIVTRFGYESGLYRFRGESRESDSEEDKRYYLLRSLRNMLFAARARSAVIYVLRSVMDDYIRDHADIIQRIRDENLQRGRNTPRIGEQ